MHLWMTKTGQNPGTGGQESQWEWSAAPKVDASANTLLRRETATMVFTRYSKALILVPSRFKWLYLTLCSDLPKSNHLVLPILEICCNNSSLPHRPGTTNGFLVCSQRLGAWLRLAPKYIKMAHNVEGYSGCVWTLGGKVLARDWKVWLPCVAVLAETGRFGTSTVDTWRTGEDPKTGPCCSG